MVSVDKWKKHFQSMAHKAFPQEDMYIVNKGSRGLGKNLLPEQHTKYENPMVQNIQWKLFLQ